MTQPPASTSVIKFDASQRRLFLDDSRVIAVNFHRQKGKDFTAAAKAVNEGMQTGQDWWIVGMTQGQADETFKKVVHIVGGMKLLLKKMFGSDVLTEEDEEFIDFDKEINHKFVCRRRTLILPNGARITSCPGRNPDSLAGRTGNLILTEFGLFIGGGYAHWDILFPITTRAGYKFIMISTPRGKNTKFYEVMSNPDGYYSTHTCDIYKSVFEEGYQLYDAKGRPFPQNTREEQELAIATYRKTYNSESKWAREYECKFTGDLSSLITWAEIERAAAIGKDLPFNHIRVEKSGQPLGDIWLALKSEAASGGRVETGWDIARTQHISALTFNFARPNRPKHLRFLVAMHDLPFAEMRSFAKAVMDLRSNSVGYGDATGLGRESNETLENLYRDRWTPFLFTSSSKRELASALKTAFTDGTQSLPSLDSDAKFVATDIYAIQKDDTGAQLMLDESPNPLLPESHCDIGYSLGLARLAGAHAPVRRAFSLPNKPAGF